MADTTTLRAEPEILLSEAEVQARVDALADEIAPHVDDETVAVVLLTGGLWFAADLTRALSRRGKNPRFDALWLTSYGDGTATSGTVRVWAALQRQVVDRHVLILDDVFDSGLSLTEATRLVREAGAAKVSTCVFARKPWPEERGLVPDFVGWEAPPRYLVGYGLDAGGRWRGLPYVGALD